MKIKENNVASLAYIKLIFLNLILFISIFRKNNICAFIYYTKDVIFFCTWIYKTSMKRNYLYKHAKYNVTLKNFQDEFLRNMIFNLYKNGTVSLSNSKDFFDEGISTEDENRAILGDIYNLLVKPENRTIELLKDGEIENITVDVNVPKQEIDEKSAVGEKPAVDEKSAVGEKPAVDEKSAGDKKPTKKRGRPKGSKNK